MIKKISILIISLALLLGMSVCTLAAEQGSETFVYDKAGLLSSYEEAELESTLEKISHANNVQIVVATVNSTDGYGINYYVNDFYDSMDLGYGDSRDGILLLVSMGTREYRILSNGAAADVITTDAIDDISDAIEPYLSDGDYAGAFDEYADKCDSYYNFHIKDYLVVSLIFGAIIGVVVAFILKAQLKSVKKRYTAREYIKNGSMNIHRTADIFLYSTVSRTPRPKNTSSSSSSSGGSRNVGGGRF